MFILTDGVPNNPEAARASIEWLRRQGVEVVVLGLGSDPDLESFCADLTPNYALVKRIENLGRQTIGQLRNVLHAGNAVGAE